MIQLTERQIKVLQAMADLDLSVALDWDFEEVENAGLIYEIDPSVYRLTEQGLVMFKDSETRATQ